MKPRLLDLFCGAGGAAMGYARAGFDVVGVDIAPQPRYPFEFIQADAMTFPLDGFDAIHASPPCQPFSAMRTTWNAKTHEDQLTPTRVRLMGSGTPWVMENVPGAPMSNYVKVCGTMFDLGVRDAELRRHRWFEVSWAFPALLPPCTHGRRPITIGVYGQHGRDRRRDVETFFSVADGRIAMGIDWMTGDELSQAIPPAYTEWLGAHLAQATAAAA